MAEEENKEESGQENKKSNNKLMIIIIGILILVILAGGVTAILLMGGDDEPQMQQSTSQTQGKVSSNRSRESGEVNSRKLNDIGILYPLDTFTVNLKSDSGRRYLNATISLELNGEELSIELDNKSPVVRDRIIRLLSSKTLEEISSKKGKKKVSEQVIDTLNAMIVDGHVKGIYFTEFVIQ